MKRPVYGLDTDTVGMTKQTRYNTTDCWNSQERIVVIGQCSATGTTNTIGSTPLIVSHAQLSMQKATQQVQSLQQPVPESSDDLVVVVQKQDNEERLPSDTEEFLPSVAHTAPNVVKNVVDWLC